MAQAADPTDPAVAPIAAGRLAAIFVSDIHLQADAPRTARAFLDFLHHHAPHARELYLLGDLFEYWAGDDDLGSPFNAIIVSALRAASDGGTAVFWMPGNRDFLIGPDFAVAAGLRILPDPSVITISGRKMVLAHGDAQCTDDLDYQAFRRQVRTPAWQERFLAQPLADRLATIAGMRAASRAAQRGKADAIMDVNQAAIAELFAQSGTQLMIHGHTHRPAVHRHVDQGIDRVRHVLPDWDFEHGAQRGGWLSIDADGVIAAVPPATIPQARAG